MLRRLHPDQPESFAFTPANRAWADAQITKYPGGAAGLRDHSAFVARAGAGRLADPSRDRTCLRHAWHGPYPRARGGDLLLHVPARPRGLGRPYPDLRHHVVHDLRGGGPRGGLQGQDRQAPASVERGWQVFVGRGRMPRRLRERAHGADRQGLLRGPDGGETGLAPRRDGRWPCSDAGPAERALCLRTGGRPDIAHRSRGRARPAERLGAARDGYRRHDQADRRDGGAAARAVGASSRAAGSMWSRPPGSWCWPRARPSTRPGSTSARRR